MMKLRPRKSLEGTNAQAAEPSKVVQPDKRGKRSVLGDVSNIGKANADDSLRPSKKAKVTEHSDGATTKENAERKESSNERRQSARLKATSKEQIHETSTERRQSARIKALQKEREAADSDTRGSTSSSARKRSARRKSRESELWLTKDTILPVSQFRLRRRNFDPSVHTEGLAPFDVKDKNNELKVSHYITDICQHLFHKEPEFHPGLYLSRQTDINSKMRAILIDWLVEVHMKFRLVQETLYLCVNLIDRYCALKPVTRAQLQLVGVTALLIACKYEEIYPPEVRDCVYITDRAYTRQQVLDMEQDILKILEWKITVPTAFPFLSRFIKIVNATELQAHAANYYMERTLQEHDFLMYSPSLVCAAAVLLSLNNSDIYRAEKVRNPILPGIPSILLEYTNFDKAALLKCASEIAKHVAEEPVTASRRQLIAVKKKFDNKKFSQISMEIRNPIFLELWNAVPKEERPYPPPSLLKYK